VTSNGNEVQSPWVGIANRNLETMIKLAKEFGMTPSARTRIRVEKQERQLSLAEMLFGGDDE
jgi:phage terminase small subunit